jgi:hypothetical protein
MFFNTCEDTGIIVVYETRIPEDRPVGLRWEVRSRGRDEWSAGSIVEME